MKQITLLMTFFFILLNSYAQNSTVFVTASTDGNTSYYLYSKALSRKGTIVEIWGKSFSAKTSFKSQGKMMSYNNTEEKTLYLFDCSKRMYRIEQSILYDSERNVIFSVSYNETTFSWTVVPPETTIDNLLGKACSL